jgi:hexosaminidase
MIPPIAGLPQLQDFKVQFAEQKVKTIRITAKSLGVCPKGHAGEGQAAWVFVDEVVVD